MQRICIRGLLALACYVTVLGQPTSARAQSVRGRVIDAASGLGISEVRVVLLADDGTRVAESVSRQEGLFLVSASRPGNYRIEVSRIGYRTVTTEPIPVASREEVVVDVQLSTEALPLRPLTITARRNDQRHEPTIEGFYARQRTLPAIGPARAIARVDPEMANALDARDVLAWMPNALRGGCQVVYWNGNLVNSADAASMWLETSVTYLEGVEHYRSSFDAPQPFRDIPSYLSDNVSCSVIALWPRTGYFGDPPNQSVPAPRRISIAAIAYAISGNEAPGMGAGVEAIGHWPVRGGLALGVHVRRTAHHLSAETMAETMDRLGQAPYVVPAGRRPLTLWVAGLEPRLTLRRAERIRPVLAARFQLARRRCTLVSTSAGTPDVGISSWGGGAGATLGTELLISRRIALHTAFTTDLLFFGVYSEIERRWNPTAANWMGFGLRAGVGYAVEW